MQEAEVTLEARGVWEVVEEELWEESLCFL
jgi:hypothetical protein